MNDPRETYASPLTAPLLTCASLIAVAAGLGAASAAREEEPFTYGPWRHSAIGGGGYIQDVVLCPSDSLRAYAYVDEARPDRLAAGLPDGIALSVDGGRTWTETDRKLPFRFQPLVAFAGERLLAGTVGNGCFWMPLSEAGAREVKASALERAPRTVPSLETEWLEGWTPAPGLRWSREGPTTLLLESETGKADGTLTKTISLPAGAARQSLVVGGRIMTSGHLTEAALSIYCEGAWEGFVDAPETREWMEFSRTMQLPEAASKARLQVTLKGEGKMWLDGLRIGVARVWKEF